MVSEKDIDIITVELPKGEKEKIEAHAKRKGQSVNAFIYRAIAETLYKEAVID